MVLESLVVPEKIGNTRRGMFFAGFIYSTVGLFLAYTVFRAQASMASVSFTAIPLVVVMYRTLRYEEGKDFRIKGNFPLLKEHLHVLYLFLYLFLGLVASFTLWYFVLPSEVGGLLFKAQNEAIIGIRRGVGTGSFTGAQDFLVKIVLNNLRVWGFCILFSFLYGAGAIFILTWNASVLAAALRESPSPMYLLHGLPEIAAYFLAALAGGIISVAVANHHYKSKEFGEIVVDSLDLVVVSLLILVASAFVEVYVSLSLMRLGL
ncbi:MAG: hypothetical protein GF334_09120 [Candidatus Altiarchaeales archaeon]|nr:hypothetical protein [Candidatus Altiarchaeales archaeon]